MWIILISDTWSQREKILKTMAILCSIAILKKTPTTLFSIDSRFKKDNYNKLSTFWIRTQTYEFLIPSIINSRLEY